MSADKDNDYGYLSKKCPECLTYISLDEVVCPSCNIRVGKITKTGMAKRPTDWNSYFMFIIAVAAFSFYIWWVFISD
ncbi:MAG: hypothetical protein FP814_00675 [Desulfobacterium sp.]|nr:hypothetical protein [Desulfobacterium sp.]MBU3947445.1 hypothetical protein [Pseudomonadota bacterium]MBU4010551.1 hypothetical protein [Pseudomonadota bacterium]MBU4037756.1 hypothetical protein [Pseudomonadota bacterium]